MCTLSLAKHFHILQIIHANLTVLISQYNNHLRNMTLQTFKTKSMVFRQSTLLPSISKKLNHQNGLNDQKSTADRNDTILRMKIDKAMKNYHGGHFQGKIEKKNGNIPHEQVKEKKEEGKNPRETMHQYKSTPKLGLSSPERKKMFRQPGQKYLKNERLSIQLKLPKPQNLNHSFDSDQQSIHKAIFQEDITESIEPIVFVLNKNQEYGKLMKPGFQKKVHMTNFSATAEKMQILENNHSLPVVPNPPSRHPSVHLQPKSQKYIKQKFVGQEAINKFYDRYKNIQRVRQIESFRLQSNPITTILTILESYNIPPKRMELIKLKGEEAILDLKNCALGAGISIKAISEIIEKVKIFQQIDLSYNQITPDLTDFIIPNLTKMRRINLSYNKIGRRGVDLLANMFWNEEETEQYCELEDLNLESNNITDNSLPKFFANLGSMNSLVVLNLSKNCLGSVAGSRLNELLSSDGYLSELYLHWCELGIKATKLIFDGLSKNDTLRVLDLSWNQIGLQSVSSLCKMVKTNLTLLHLDISYCQIDEIDTKRITKALRHNQTIYGIHYQGNMGYIDFKGNLHHITKGNQETPVSIRAGLIQRIDSINIISDYYKGQHVTLQKNVCWICEGWQEKYFKIQKEQGEKACFIHLDFQNFTGVLMIDKGTYYQFVRMCPPKQIQIFYTKVTALGKFIQIYDSSPRGQIKTTEDKQILPDFIIEKKQFRNVKLDKINKIDQPAYLSQIFSEEYETSIHCQPRSDDMKAEHLFVQKPPKVKKPKKIKKKIEIKQPNLIKEIKVKDIPEEFQSVFHKKAGDGDSYDEFIRKCVDFDVKHSKVVKILKNEQDLQDIRYILQKNYDLFQKIYYYLANNNPNSNGVFSISETRFQKFVQEQGYETRRVTKAKIRLKLVSCVSQTSSDSQVSSFYRPQFFQFLLRLAIEKWCSLKREEQDEEQRRPLTVGQAFQKMLKTLRKYEQHSEAALWRQQNLTSYQVSIVIKSYSYVLEHVYNKYAGLYQKNMNTKSKKKMFLEEMKTMFLQAEIRKTRETLKDLEIAYRTVKKLQIQDGLSDTGIDYVQFLECFCRFAEGLFLTPIGSEDNHLWEKEVVQSEEIPLFLKIQKLLKMIYSKSHDLYSKKYEMVFVHGLFPEEVVVLMEHFKQKYEHRDHLHKIYHLSHLSHHAKVNSFEGKKEKITLNFLIQLLAVKAKKIQAQNRQKILEMEAERERMEKEAKLEEENEQNDSDCGNND